MSKNLKITLIVIISVLAFSTLICGGIVAIVYFGMREEFAEPVGIRVALTNPDRVTVGQTFTIEVRVYNDAGETQTIESIDVYDSYLDGVRLKSSDPAWASSAKVFDFVTYDYNLDIPAGGEQVLTFEAVALKAGDFQGDLDVCINNDFSFVTQVVRTVVEPAAASDIDDID